MIKSCFINLLNILYISVDSVHTGWFWVEEWTRGYETLIEGLPPSAYIGTVNIGMLHV